MVKLGSHCAVTCDYIEVHIAKCALEQGPICASKDQLLRLVIAQCEPGFKSHYLALNKYFLLFLE